MLRLFPRLPNRSQTKIEKYVLTFCCTNERTTILLPPHGKSSVRYFVQQNCSTRISMFVWVVLNQCLQHCSMFNVFSRSFNVLNSGGSNMSFV